MLAVTGLKCGSVNYLALQSPEELIKVFPNAQKYIKPDGFDSGFALAMVFLEANKFNSTNLFALNLLFQALNDPERAKKINNLYDFNLKKFIELTAVYDIFSVEKNSSSPWLNIIMRKIRSNSLLKTFWILRKNMQKNWR
jgi:hypothetical protein